MLVIYFLHPVRITLRSLMGVVSMHASIINSHLIKVIKMLFKFQEGFYIKYIRKSLAREKIPRRPSSLYDPASKIRMLHHSNF